MLLDNANISSKVKLMSYLLHSNIMLDLLLYFSFHLFILLFISFIFPFPYQSFYVINCNVKSIFKKLYHMAFFKVIQTWPK